MKSADRTEQAGDSFKQEYKAAIDRSRISHMIERETIAVMEHGKAFGHRFDSHIVVRDRGPMVAVDGAVVQFLTELQELAAKLDLYPENPPVLTANGC